MYLEHVVVPVVAPFLTTDEYNLVVKFPHEKEGAEIPNFGHVNANWATKMSGLTWESSIHFTETDVIVYLFNNTLEPSDLPCNLFVTFGVQPVLAIPE